MKTLIISLYDGTTNCSAAILNTDNNSLMPIEISNNIYYLFYYKSWLSTSTDKEDVAAKAKINRFLDKYDSIILCEDGEIEKIK